MAVRNPVECQQKSCPDFENCKALVESGLNDICTSREAEMVARSECKARRLKDVQIEETG